MLNKFKNQVRTLRENRFGGRSVRSLKDELQPHFGEHYYAYVSKLESGVLPPVDFLKKIKDAYGLSTSEYEDLMHIYLLERFEDHLADAHRAGVNVELHSKPLLFRKVKKKSP